MFHWEGWYLAIGKAATFHWEDKDIPLERLGHSIRKAGVLH